MGLQRSPVQSDRGAMRSQTRGPRKSIGADGIWAVSFGDGATGGENFDLTPCDFCPCGGADDPPQGARD